MGRAQRAPCDPVWAGHEPSGGAPGEPLGRVFCCRSGSWRAGGRAAEGHALLSRSGKVKVRSPLTISGSHVLLSLGWGRDWESPPAPPPPSCPPKPDSASSVHGQVPFGSPRPGLPRAPGGQLLGVSSGRQRDPAPLSVPDSLVLKVLSQRLSQQDCVQRGWVLHGFPRDLDQAHLLDTTGHKPNR